jgi:hypothetical protein
MVVAKVVVAEEVIPVRPFLKSCEISEASLRPPL